MSRKMADIFGDGFKTIRSRLLVVFVLLVLLSAVGTGFSSIVVEFESGKRQAFDKLESVAALKESEIRTWLQNMQIDLLALAGEPVYEKMVLLLSGDSNDKQAEFEKEEIYNRFIQVIELTKRYDEFLLISRQGIVVVSTDQLKVGEFRGLQPYFREGLERAGVHLQTKAFSSVSERLNNVVVVYPVVDGRGNAMGVICGVARSSALNAKMGEWTGLGSTGETYLVGSNHVLATVSRSPSFTPGMTAVHSYSADAALYDHKSGSAFYDNYRGIPVLGVYHYVPEINAVLIAEQEKAEAFQPIYTTLALSAIVALVAVLLAGAASFHFARVISSPLADLAKTATLIGAGALDLTARVEHKDEIGVLAQSFNFMTERLKATMEGLRKSEEKYRQIFENANEGIFQTSLEGRFLAANPALARILGYDSPSELVSTITDISRQLYVDPADRKAFTGDILEQKAALGRELRMYTKDGQQIWVFISVRVVRSDAGDPLYFEGTLTDITKRKRAEEALRESERKFRAIFDQTFQLMGLLGLDGTILEVNETALRFSGIEPSEVIGKPFWEGPWWKHSAELQEELHVAVKKAGEGEFMRFEVTHPSTDGKIHHIDFSLKPYRNENGEVILLIPEGRDITERKAIEEALKESQARLSQYAETLEQNVRERTAQLEISNRELESFSYSVSHDLRSPLRGIDGWSQALMEDCLDQIDENGRKHLERIRKETRRMGELIDGLLELSRVSRSEMTRELVNLSVLARRVADRLVEMEPERQVEFVIQPGLEVYGDPRLLEALINNLFGNSWKFTGTHNSARIELGRAIADGGRVLFVRDDGVGFEMAYAANLFAPFQRMHKNVEFPGSGIGLATVQRIVHRHGGVVWAEAKVEEGTTIYFTL